MNPFLMRSMHTHHVRSACRFFNRGPTSRVVCHAAVLDHLHKESAITFRQNIPCTNIATDVPLLHSHTEPKRSCPPPAASFSRYAHSVAWQWRPSALHALHAPR